MTTTTNAPKLGDIVVGRCVTMGTHHTGRVAEIIEPVRFSGQTSPRYRLVDTGEAYANGRPKTPIVECASVVVIEQGPEAEPEPQPVVGEIVTAVDQPMRLASELRIGMLAESAGHFYLLTSNPTLAREAYVAADVRDARGRTFTIVFYDDPIGTHVDTVARWLSKAQLAALTAAALGEGQVDPELRPGTVRALRKYGLARDRTDIAGTELTPAGWAAAEVATLGL